MNPDQDLRLTCIELAQELHGVDDGYLAIVKTARRYYQFICGKDGTVKSAQISPPHRVIARIRRETFEDEVDTE